MTLKEQPQQIELIVRQIISENHQGLSPEKITPDIPLLDQGIDSFELMKVLVQIENTFGTTMSEEDLMNSWNDSLHGIVKSIEKLLQCDLI